MNFDKYKNAKPYASKRTNEQVWKDYTDEDRRLVALFKEDLFAEFGIQNNSKKDLLFNIAWDYGHASGYSEVYNYAADLVFLIED